MGCAKYTTIDYNTMNEYINNMRKLLNGRTLTNKEDKDIVIIDFLINADKCKSEDVSKNEDFYIIGKYYKKTMIPNKKYKCIEYSKKLLEDYTILVPVPTVQENAVNSYKSIFK